MTPEQENELVARWMGWAPVPPRGLHKGERDWFHVGKSEHYRHDYPPPYRTDPALLWEVMCVLSAKGWAFHLADEYTAGMHYGIHEDTGLATDICVTLAEAVFAAAVMQAEQEPKQ